MEDELIPGCLIQCKILGYLETYDDHGNDPKIIVCPIECVDPTYTNINNILDLPIHTLNKIVYFFSHYKDLENKVVKIGKWMNSEDANKVYKESLIRYSEIFPNINNIIINSDGYKL